MFKVECGWCVWVGVLSIVYTYSVYKVVGKWCGYHVYSVYRECG